jgi:hypothetical protein
MRTLFAVCMLVSCVCMLLVLILQFLEMKAFFIL